MSKPFRIRGDVEDWFSQIAKQKPINTKFDLYYFCLMLGLATRRESEPNQMCPSCTDFVDNFVSDYRNSQRLIIGLLIRAELSYWKINITEKEAVRKKFGELVDPQSQTHLTNEGMDRLNQYSSGGFDYLTEQLDSKPYDVEEFLRSYAKLLREAVDENPDWQPKS